MGSKEDAPSWADQWGAGGVGDGSENKGAGADAKKEKKTATGSMKVVASESLGKAKAAALVGAHKVKSGTSSGIKWVKEQYQKRTSK